MGIHLCCSSITFRTAPLEVALAEIAQAGFSAVDLVSVPGFCDHYSMGATPEYREEVARELKRHRLNVVALTCVPGQFNAPDAEEDAIIQTGMAYVELAARLGVPAINVNCGLPVRDRSRFEESIRKQASGLARLAAMAEYFGIGLNVEAPHARGLCQTLEDAEALFQAIDAPNVRVLLDVTHVASAGSAPADAVARFHGKIGHVHLRDATGKDIHQTPGDGAIEFRPFFEALEESGYQGWCAVELEIPDDSVEARRRELRRCLDCLLPQMTVAGGYGREA